MRFQLSIRGALIAITVIAFYCAILGLAYNGDVWGSGISVSVTLCLLIWLFSAGVYWGFMGLLALTGVHEAHQAHSVAANRGPDADPPTSGSSELLNLPSADLAEPTITNSVSDLLSEDDPS